MCFCKLFLDRMVISWLYHLMHVVIPHMMKVNLRHMHEDHHFVDRDRIQWWKNNTNQKRIMIEGRNTFDLDRVVSSHICQPFLSLDSCDRHGVFRCRTDLMDLLTLCIENNFLTVANRLISSSDAPIAARPISCENCAKFGSAKSGTWPNNSWQQSL